MSKTTNTSIARLPDDTHFFLVGDCDGELGDINSGLKVVITDLVGPASQQYPAGPDAPCSLKFSRPIELPGWALNPDGSLRTTDDLRAALGAVAQAQRQRLLALLQEAQRRLLSIDIDATGAIFLNVSTPFGNGTAFAAAHARVALWNFDDVAGPALAVSADLSAFARLASGAAERAVALVIHLVATGAACLRLEADDWNISLPDFKLPSFDLSGGFSLPLADQAMQAAAGVFGRLDPQASVRFDYPKGGVGEFPLLALRARGSIIDWALVQHDFDATNDWPNANTKLAVLNAEVTIGAMPAAISITGIRLASLENGAVVEGTVQVEPNLPVISISGPRRFGPLEVSWRSLTVQPSVVLGSGGSVQARVAFSHLTLRVYDDPSAALTFSGIIDLDPSGAMLVELHLEAPFPLTLVAKAVGTMLRAGASVMKVLLDAAELAAGQVSQLLEILGKIALAAGRAALFIGEQIGGALAAAGDLLQAGLAAISELVGALFKQLSQLSAGAGALSVELRIATHPFELRQILVTLRSNNALPGADAKLLGMHVTIPAYWKPGLLVDFVNQPGAYLVLSCDTDPGQNEQLVATISTDLWLNQPGASTAVRDTDGKATDPGARDKEQAPLLSLELKRASTTGAASTMVVLAGIQRGQAVFFQQLVGEATQITIPGSAVKVRSIDGPFLLKPIDHTQFAVDVKFEEDRILPLLGMGEPGDKSAAPPDGGDQPSFLEKLQGSLANVIWVKSTTPYGKFENRAAGVNVELGLKAAGLETSLLLKAEVSLDTLELTFNASDEFAIESQRVEEKALGMLWVIEQTNEVARLANAKVEMFKLGFSGGQSGFELNRKVARMELRFDALSGDGKGVVFEVTTFKIGPGGLDLVAKVKDNPVRLNGINVPFRFTEGSLEIKGGKLVSAMIAGRGSLPKDLIGEADCTIALTFGDQAGKGIVLQSGKVELDKKNDPVVCHASRFTLTITNLDIGFVNDGGYHFFYMVTGSLRFTPKPGEFESGLLQYLDDVEINLERTPLSADPSVLARHISFQKTLNPKKSFNLFNLFTFELRGFGYHPASPKFDGDPAVNISGQIKFVEMGDVMQPSIDFHGLWIAPPAEGQSLPRVKADGLGIDLNMKGSIRVRGTVIAVDPDTKTVEGSELAPPEFNTYGFLGRGEFDIPGWGSMGASLGFLELERKDQPGERRKCFYFFAEKKKMAIEIPTVVWNFYLREAGFGMGFRYTLDAINAADKATSIPKLISALDEVSKRQGDLHKFSSWKPEPEGDRVTLALKGAIQVYPASKEWNEEQEEAAQNPFMFDIVAAIRSDFTLFMGLRGWVGTNYIDYLNDKEQLRSNPGLRGYLYISAPQQRLLARMIGDSKGYIGDRLPALAKVKGQEDPPMRRALKSVDWSATLFIKPGLFHYELGWPNQLVVRLFDEPNMRVIVRGGMIFRAADDGLLWGYNVEAEAFFKFGGSLEAGSIGVCAEATLNATLVARVLCYLSWRFKGSLIYGLIALDATLAVSVRAWMEIDLGFTSFTLRIGFSVSLQFSAAVEIAISTEGVGARVAARVALSIFGCTLSVSVGFEAGKGQLEDARARVQRFLAMSITSEEPDAAPATVHASGDERINADAQNAQESAAPRAPRTTPTPGLKPRVERSHLGITKLATNFWLVMHRATSDVNDHNAFALLLPTEAVAGKTQVTGAFYAAPCTFVEGTANRDDMEAAHVLSLPKETTAEDAAAIMASLAKLQRWVAETGRFEAIVPGAIDALIAARAAWNDTVPNVENHPGLTMAHLFDECFLSDTQWQHDASKVPYRTTTTWNEPNARVHLSSERAMTGSEHERNSQRDMAQRARAADQQADPVSEAVHQARSTILALFIEQFEALAKDGVQPVLGKAGVGSLGLLFFGPRDDLAVLKKLVITKIETDTPGPGAITVFNPPSSWFEHQDPVLASDSFAVAHDGVKLNWRLETEFARVSKKTRASAQSDPEQYLHHYEILRTVEGMEFTPEPMRVKPTATIGKRTAQEVRLIAPDWQFVDDLAGLPPDLRRALLPSNDEELALEAAKLWAALFGTRSSLQLTYTVTAFDGAGTHGLAKSFSVPIYRPAPKLRPAEAQLRFVLTGLGVPGSGEPWDRALPPTANLAVVMGLKDASREAAARSSGIERHYELIADPEDISPSGHYGTDGLTERRLGIASNFGMSADARRWRLDPTAFANVADANGKVPADTFIDALEPDHETLVTFPHWALLAGVTGLARIDATLGPRMIAPKAVHKKTGPQDFIDSLWRRDGITGARIATRFALVTVQIETVTGPDGKSVDVRSESRPVPVTIEVRIEARDPLAQEIGLLRPEAFEWPVHLDMPAHQANQVHVRTGFARFRVPPHDASFANIANIANAGKLTGCLQVRDPERRILTEVGFDAAPDFDANGVSIDSAHASSIAGFDLHELDLDDLAALDTASTPLFASNATTWSRARRVARIERVSAETARLLPDTNRDWPGWHAHYPTETWRLQNRSKLNSGQSSPRRAAWFSAAESTLQFAARVPRMRLLPTVSEGTISELMMRGQPTTLKVAFVTYVVKNVNDKTEPHLAALHAAVTAPANLHFAHLGFDGLPCEPEPFAPLNGELINIDNGKPIDPYFVIRHETDNIALDAVHVRAALIGISWKVPKEQREALAHALATDRRLSFAIEVTGSTTARDGKSWETGKTTIALAFDNPQHALLEEVLGELEYSVAGSASALYRRYVVSVQPAPQIETANLAGFLAGTPAETDPYGWAALQQLGLATTIKLFDRNDDSFVDPKRLHRHVNQVFARALERYQTCYRGVSLGQPFADVLLRPGSDRIAGPFDAVLKDGSVETDTDVLALNDAGLAIVQLSLRPVRARVRQYSLLAMGWEAAEWPHWLRTDTDPETNQPVSRTVSRTLLGYELHFPPHSTLTYEVVRAVDGLRLTVVPGSAAAVMPMLTWPKSARKEVQPDPALRFYYRHAGGHALPVLMARVRTTTTTTSTSKDGATTSTSKDGATTEALLALTDLKLLVVSQNKFPAYGMRSLDPKMPAPALIAADQPAQLTEDSPFERFPALSAAELAALFTSGAPEQPPGTPRHEHMTEALTAFNSLRANLAWVKRDLTWPGDFAALAQVLGAYLPWQQRFLDHGAMRADTPVLQFALAAPVKANPLQLAADAEGQVRLSFLHADRWAHARVYAVRPTPRYQHLALGAGYYASQGETEQLISERLITRSGDTATFKVPIGYALAVSPRTERIEPPVILGTELVGDEWQLVLAQHGEEALAASNRPLFARLQTDGTALSFVREYRDPAWPGRMARAMEEPQQAVLYPPREPALPTQVPDTPTGVDALALRQLASAYPSLWKGAQVIRIGQLPAHYRVSALAVARAGLVVSRVVGSMQDATPRKALQPRGQAGNPGYDTQARKLLGEPALVLSRVGDGELRIALTKLRLVSHADLAQDSAQPWISDDPQDVAWWPDPNVRYTLLRRGSGNAGKAFEDEDAAVNLVASPAPEEADSSPVVVRCRGNRFRAGPVVEDTAGGAILNPAIQAEADARGQHFLLAFQLEPVADNGSQDAQSMRTVNPVPGAPAMRASFNAAAMHFARMGLETTVSVGPFAALPLPATLEEAQNSIRAMADQVRRAAITLVGAAQEPVLRAMTEIAAEFDTAAAALSNIADWDATAARLKRERLRSVVLDGDPASQQLIQPDLENGVFGVAQDVTATEVLNLFGLPADDEAAAVADSGHPLASREHGRLWKACRERLMGGADRFAIRAVDTRNAIERVEGKPKWQTPGEVEVGVHLPEWNQWL